MSSGIQLTPRTHSRRAVDVDLERLPDVVRCLHDLDRAEPDATRLASRHVTVRVAQRHGDVVERLVALAARPPQLGTGHVDLAPARAVDDRPRQPTRGPSRRGSTTPTATEAAVPSTSASTETPWLTVDAVARTSRSSRRACSRCAARRAATARRCRCSVPSPSRTSTPSCAAGCRARRIRPGGAAGCEPRPSRRLRPRVELHHEVEGRGATQVLGDVEAIGAEHVRRTQPLDAVDGDRGDGVDAVEDELGRGGVALRPRDRRGISPRRSGGPLLVGLPPVDRQVVDVAAPGERGVRAARARRRGRARAAWPAPVPRRPRASSRTTRCVARRSRARSDDQ